MLFWCAAGLSLTGAFLLGRAVGRLGHSDGDGYDLGYRHGRQDEARNPIY